MSKKLKNKEARLKEKAAFARCPAERDYYEAELACVSKLMYEEQIRKRILREENARGWV